MLRPLIRLLAHANARLRTVAGVAKRQFARIPSEPPSDAEKIFVFNRKHKRIQRDRAALNPQSRMYDYLREEVASRLADRIFDIRRSEFPTVLDLGAGPGTMLKHLQDKGVTTLFQMDSSELMLLRDIDLDKNYSLKPIRVIGDEEALPFKTRSMDLIVSNLSLHWVNDLPGTFWQISHILKEDGAFIGAMFGEKTLQELRHAFVLAEQERDGGVSPHVSPFAGVADVGNLLTRAFMALPTIDTEDIVVRYSDPFVLMQDLRSMGENNASRTRSTKVNRQTLMAAAAAYNALYADPVDGSIPATFQVIYMIGWAPHHSQPKPKPRGSAERSFKELAAEFAGTDAVKEITD